MGFGKMSTNMTFQSLVQMAIKT